MIVLMIATAIVQIGLLLVAALAVLALASGAVAVGWEYPTLAVGLGAAALLLWPLRGPAMKLVQVFSAVISVLGTFAYVLWPILVLLALVMWVAQLGWDWVR